MKIDRKIVKEKWNYYAQFKLALQEEAQIQKTSKIAGFNSMRALVKEFWNIEHLQSLNDDQLKLLIEGLKRHDFQIQRGIPIRKLKERVH